MNDFYEWLYNHYAKPRLTGIPFSSEYYAQDQEWQAAAEQLSRRDRLLACDLMETMKNEWGMLVFACGVQAGLALAEDLEEKQPRPTSPIPAA